VAADVGMLVVKDVLDDQHGGAGGTGAADRAEDGGGLGIRPSRG
jgi:hypothetical protein